MKKLYFLDETEKERILNLHETATKNQYLINEVGYGSGNWVDVNYKSQTLTLNNYLEMENRQGGDELKLNKGVVFTVKNSNTLVAKNTPFQIVGDFTGSVSENGRADVEYYCSKKEFKIIGRDLTYWGEDFQSSVQKAFDDLCGEASTAGQSSTDTGQTQLEKNAISCGWKKNDGSADVDGYKNANWACPKPGVKKKTNTVNKTKTTQTQQINYSDYGI